MIANAQARDGIKLKISLTYVHYRFIRSTTLAGLNDILRSGPGYNLNRGRRLHLWPLGEMGDLHSQDWSELFLKYTSVVLVYTVVTQVHLAHLQNLASHNKSTGT